MSKNRPHVDTRQMELDFDAKIELYQKARSEVLDVYNGNRTTHKNIESIDEIYIGNAVACKQAIRDSGLSREQVLEGINAYLQASGGVRELSIHMLNHYLSKPAEYPMPLHIIYALQGVTLSLAPIKTVAEDFDAKVITREETRQMALGKLDETIAEMMRLKRELRGKR